MAFNAGPLYTDALIESMAAFLEALPVSPAKLQYLQAGRPGAGATLQMGFTIRRHDCRLASFRGEGQATLRNLCRLPRREGGGQSRPEFPETRQQAGLVPDPGSSNTSNMAPGAPTPMTSMASRWLPSWLPFPTIRPSSMSLLTS